MIVGIILFEIVSNIWWWWWCGVMDDIKGLDNSLNCVPIVLVVPEPRRSN